jgi:uncharacterized protein (DUF488 family)
MYYRRKIILALLEKFDNQLNKTDFQKLLMILSHYQKKPSYDFIPYKYGCFSFRSYSDISTMIKYDLIEEATDNKWRKVTNESYLNSILPDDKKLIEYIYNNFKDKLGKKLIQYTYRKFPYYAINSLIAKDLLNKEELSIVSKHRNIINDPVIATIGYEGITLEEYINRLIYNDIKILIDVRKNPISMKIGFSKNQLSKACKSVNIEYAHIPEVGIDSKLRKELSDQESYDQLFKLYKLNFNSSEFLIGKKKIIDLVNVHGRVALTCFECNINQCHRKPLSENIMTALDNIKINHI